jgi:hypothetical protein
MTRFTLGVLAAAGFSLAVPTYAEDPPADGSAEEMIREQEAEAKAYQASATTQVEEVRSGAGSMEPAATESDEERAERAFVANIWNSP